MAQGKKTIIDYEMVKKYAMLGLKEEEIALLLGINKVTLSKRKAKDDKLANAIKEGQLLAKTSITKALYNAALNGNITACIFFLVNRYPDDWKNINKVEHSGEMKFEPIRFVLKEPKNDSQNENNEQK
jgi:hypothetical protein